MPTLAKFIVESNAAGGNDDLNFKGFAVGNPYTNPYSLYPAMISDRTLEVLHFFIYC